MRVAINGIGVAGPALAYWLRRFGHEPVLFERAPALRSGGYIIDFWGLGYDLAERMGVVAELRERGYFMRRLVGVDAVGRAIVSIDVEPLRARLGERFVSVARADVSGALFRACAGVEAHFGVAIEDIRQEARSALVGLSDGRTERFDLVVGADGLHSHVRSVLFGSDDRIVVPIGCHVAAVRLRDYPHRDELAYVSHTTPGRQVARVSMRGGETLVLFICRSELVGDERPAERERSAPVLRRVFGGMAWEVPEILDRVDAADDIYFDGVSQVHLPHWSAGRVSLVGDAAACASFLAGEGTGLAIVEAYVLAGELHRANGDVARAFAAYEARLRAFVRGKQRTAVRLRGFFAPGSAASLALRNAGMRLFSWPFVTRHLFLRSLRDRLDLPRYEDG